MNYAAPLGKPSPSSSSESHFEVKLKLNPLSQSFKNHSQPPSTKAPTLLTLVHPLSAQFLPSQAYRSHRKLSQPQCCPSAAPSWNTSRTISFPWPLLTSITFSKTSLLCPCQQTSHLIHGSASHRSCWPWRSPPAPMLPCVRATAA